MSKLIVTLIDVGWGDSIFLESEDSSGNRSFGLIDSNDSTYSRSSYIFLKKYFERTFRDGFPKPHAFAFVVLSHAHADHGQGLKLIMRSFGTTQFWYPKSTEWSSLKELVRFANKSTQITHHQAIDATNVLPNFGDVSVGVMWPKRGQIDAKNENNNSVVLSFQLANVSFVLTGDAEAPVWQQIAPKIPKTTLLFKVPHHGSENGTFDASGKCPWLVACPVNTHLAISAHNRPFGHPDKAVIDFLKQNNRIYYRTDEQYHLSFVTDGNYVQAKYSHF